MSKKPHYDVSGSSMVSLKAELFRKQAESRKRGEHNQSATVQQGYVAVQNNSLNSKINSKLKKQDGENKRDVEHKSNRDSPEDDRSWEKVKLKLLEKSKRYDKLEAEQYIPDDGDAEHLLVDFSRKIRSSQYFDQSNVTRASSDSDSDSEIIGPIPPPPSAAEEWVEYQDYLGRTRKCLRKDLPSLTADNEKRGKETAHRGSPGITIESYQPLVERVADTPASSGFDFGGSRLDERTLMSNDMQRELERLAWEKDELSHVQATADSSTLGKVPVHYQSVENNEKRKLGVGYYNFSKVEEIRNQELENLKKLQEQTIGQRAQTDLIKAKRKAAMDTRLAKIRERKLLKGEPVAPLEQVDNDDNDEFEKALAAKSQPIVMEDLTPVQKTGVRPWDKGKVHPSMEDPNMADKKYVDTRREERNFDFAPPPSYSTPATSKFGKGQNPSHTSKLPRDFQHMSYEYTPHQPPPSFPAEQKLPESSQPWEKMQPWKERVPNKQEEESSPAHLEPVRDARPWQFAPPPNTYSEGRAGEGMIFEQVQEHEIREQARKLFAKAQTAFHKS